MSLSFFSEQHPPQDPTQMKPLPKLRAKDKLWAQEAVRDLFLTCVLNITLKNGEVCEKYLCDMTDAEGTEYFRMIHELFDVDKKKL